ncbi:AAA family ATPase [Candidatus Microgenomates bacterium]|nr:AAA family ATPase [Candidatus Microgenomates bacterium]
MSEETAWSMYLGVNKTFDPPKEDVLELQKIFRDAHDYVYKNPPDNQSKQNSYQFTKQQTEPKIIPNPKKLAEIGAIRIEERKLEMLAPSTGYPELDNYIRGFVPKHLITITGDTNTGKTAICANFAVRVASQKKRVLYIALEPDTAIVDSIACARTGKKFEDLTDENLSHEDENIDIYTKEIRTIEDLKTAISQLNGDSKYDLIIIDHIGYFVRGASDGAYIQEQANLLKDLATFANDQLFAVLVVAHLRKPDRHQKKDRIPTADDIAGSAAFKQDSDEVLILTRKTFTNSSGIIIHAEDGNLIIAKTKSSGGNGLVNLIFSPQSAFITTPNDWYHPNAQPKQEGLVFESSSGGGKGGSHE